MPFIATALVELSHPAVTFIDGFGSHTALCQRGIAFDREPRALSATYNALRIREALSITAACNLSGFHCALQLLYAVRHK